jgi:DNA replication protein DnaC
MLLGQTGVGKTHLAAGSVHELCNRRQDAVMATGSGFTAYMRQFEDGTADWYRRRTRTCGWLAIDDIGAAGHDPSGYLLSEYEALIDERYRMARPTLVTTNLSEGDLRAVIGERAVSRLYDTTRSVQVVMKDCVDLRRVSA